MLTSGTGSYQVTNWKKDIQKKYDNRFTITNEYDSMTIPSNIIVDNKTNKEYVIKHYNHSIKELIITIRKDKITQIINGH